MTSKTKEKDEAINNDLMKEKQAGMPDSAVKGKLPCNFWWYKERLII